MSAFQGDAFQGFQESGPVSPYINTGDNALGIPVTVVALNGLPVVLVTALGEPGVVVADGGMPITLVSDLGRPMIL